MSQFFDQIVKRASQCIKTIILPEGGDERTIGAAAKASAMGYARVIVLGNAERIGAALSTQGANFNMVQVIDPLTSDHHEHFAAELYELRRHKGLTPDKAHELVRDEMYFGMMMLQLGLADGLVAGAVHSSADTIRPALQIIKAAEGMKTVSSLFFMCFPTATYLYSDCGLVEDPTDSQLADIAVATAKTAMQFGIEPRVALLSYSTKGSASGPGPSKMIRAMEMARETLAARYGDKVVIDGELQFDAAFVPEVAAKKAPNSPLGGRANVFIFPDLGAGNICYKVTQRLAGAEAYGPILQGLRKPVNDLSRGCTADDIAATIAITSIQACS